MNRTICLLLACLALLPAERLGAQQTVPFGGERRTVRPPANEPARMPLTARRGRNEAADASPARATASPWLSTAGALGLILVSILGLAWLLKGPSRRLGRGLPPEAIEILGKRPLDARLALHLIRCGSRILIVGAGPDGLRTLAEITDPVEVDLLAGLCRPRPESATVVDSFRALFQRRNGAPEPAGAAAPHFTRPAPDSLASMLARAGEEHGDD